MPTPNSPEGGQESAEGTKKNTGGKNIESLIKKISRDNSGGFDPRILNELQAGGTRRSKILEEIRDSMVAGFGEDEYSFDAGTINKISNEELRGYLELFSRPLRTLRENFPKRIKRTFRDTDIAVSDIENDIFGYSEKELGNILDSTANMRRYLTDTLHIPREEIQLWKPNLRKLFEPENIPDSDFKNRLVTNIERFEKSNVPFDREFIREFIGVYDKDKAKIKAISDEFGITLSIRDALMWGVVSTEKVDKYVENTYTDIWDKLSESQKKSLYHAVRTDDTFEFTFTELEEHFESQFDKLADGKRFKELFAKSIRGGFDEYNSQPERESLTTSFSDFIQKIETGKTKIRISPLSELGEGSVLICQEAGGKKRFLKIEKVDVEMNIHDGVAGITLSFLDGHDEGTIGKAKGSSTLSYESLEEKLAQMNQIQVISEDDLRKQVKDGMFTDDTGQVMRDVTDEEDDLTFEYFKNKLDSLDAPGKDINIEEGMVFAATVDAPDGKSGKIEQAFTVLSVNNGVISFTNGRDKEEATFRDFVQIIERGGNFHRIAVLKSDDDFIKALGSFGVKSDTKISGNSLKTEDEVDAHDSHVHSHKVKKELKYEYFKGDNGDSHIRIYGIDDGTVVFGEYDPGSGVDLEKLKKAKGAKKLSKAQEKSQYKIRQVSRAQFLVYLKKAGLKATTDDLLDPGAGYHPHDAHMHGGGIMGLFKGPSINDVLKAFSNITHGFEHYFEKNSKLNASRVALKMGRQFGFPADLMAQLQADEVGSMKEIIEKIQDKLFNLNGPVARNKALHIAELTSSSAEEVGAAMIYMVKSYGHLYAEDIAYAQGKEKFLTGFLYSLGWKNPAEMAEMKREARSKFLADLGSMTDGGEPTEEEIIWGLLKIIDGKAGRKPGEKGYDPRFANAGAVVKAMGGPSGWEKAWRTEGMENAYQKGIRQGGAVVNAQGRVNKGLSAFKTFELNTARGFMEKAAGKAPDPSMQTISVIWALGGYSKHCSTEMLQKVKGYGDSQGHTFHAYSFLRNGKDNDIYTKVFVQALSSMDAGAGHDAQAAIDTIRKGPLNKDKETKEAYESAIDTLDKIWRKYQGKGLHDHLQGKSTWIIDKINQGNTDVQDYAKKFAEIHLMNSSETPPPNDNDWWIQYGYHSSGIFGDNAGNATKEKDGKKVLSLNGTLNKLRVNGYEIGKNEYDRLWPVVKGAFESLEKEPDEKLRKAQYKQFREDVISHFRNRMSIRAGGIPAAVTEVQRKDYYKGLRYMGIDAEELFMSTDISIGAEAGYASWQRHKGGSIETMSESVQDWAKKKTRANLKKDNSSTSANDDQLRQAP